MIAGSALEYRSAVGVLADEDSRPLRPSREHRALVDKLNADGDSGFRAVDVILARPRD